MIPNGVCISIHIQDIHKEDNKEVKSVYTMPLSLIIRQLFFAAIVIFSSVNRAKHNTEWDCFHSGE